MGKQLLCLFLCVVAMVTAAETKEEVHHHNIQIGFSMFGGGGSDNESIQKITDDMSSIREHMKATPTKEELHQMFAEFFIRVQNITQNITETANRPCVDSPLVIGMNENVTKILEHVEGLTAFAEYVKARAEYWGITFKYNPVAWWTVQAFFCTVFMLFFTNSSAKLLWGVWWFCILFLSFCAYAVIGVANYHLKSVLPVDANSYSKMITDNMGLTEWTINAGSCGLSFVVFCFYGFATLLSAYFCYVAPAKDTAPVPDGRFKSLSKKALKEVGTVVREQINNLFIQTPVQTRSAGAVALVRPKPEPVDLSFLRAPTFR
jgi:hypothetical protein